MVRLTVPARTPEWDRSKVQFMLESYGGISQYAVRLLGVRGYYRNSMGIVGRNDRGIYDDAIFVHTPDASASFNANTDPSVHRDRVASLVPGLYLYKLGTHGLSRPVAQRYEALVQASEVTVFRDGAASFDRGYFGINIHRGSYNSTSSAGCQTIHPSQWSAFIALVKSELKRHRQTRTPYILIEAQG